MNIKTKADLGRQIDWLASLEAKASGFCQLNYKKADNQKPKGSWLKPAIIYVLQNTYSFLYG